VIKKLESPPIPRSTGSLPDADLYVACTIRHIAAVVAIVASATVFTHRNEISSAVHFGHAENTPVLRSCSER
jgi:hypothetical protein